MRLFLFGSIAFVAFSHFSSVRDNDGSLIRRRDSLVRECAICPHLVRYCRITRSRILWGTESSRTETTRRTSKSTQSCSKAGTRQLQPSQPSAILYTSFSHSGSLEPDDPNCRARFLTWTPIRLSVQGAVAVIYPWEYSLYLGTKAHF